MSQQEHWEKVYGGKPSDQVSWYRPHLERSLMFILDAKLEMDAPIIDVGGGSSTLVDDLLDLGYRDVSVLDLSQTAIDVAKRRLGSRAAEVTWIIGDVTTLELPNSHFEFWHDRAVFHFLTEPSARLNYVAGVRRSLKVDGHIVVATFGDAGPEQCSGLDVAHYNPEALHAQFGVGFSKVSSRTEMHSTPWGTQQEFVYCYCRRDP